MVPLFSDDGTEINPDLIPKPGLCLICQKQNDQNERILCTLNIIDQQDEDEFKCFAFEDINEKKKASS